MASIKCGNCKSTHATVADVRKCYGNSGRFNGSVPLPSVSDWATPESMERAATPLDRIRAAAAKLPNVDRMRYAVVRSGTVEGTRFNFYQVDRPQKGKWAGYTFVKQMLSEELMPIRNMGATADILEAIARDPQKAASDFGLQTEHCGKCNRRLTRDDSRQRGYGPDCAQMMGMAF